MFCDHSVNGDYFFTLFNIVMDPSMRYRLIKIFVFTVAIVIVIVSEREDVKSAPYDSRLLAFVAFLEKGLTYHFRLDSQLVTHEARDQGIDNVAIRVASTAAVKVP